MTKVYGSGVITILVILFLVTSMMGFSNNENEKKGNKKSELVFASLDVSGPSSLPEAKESINRGEFITINAQLKNDSIKI